MIFSESITFGLYFAFVDALIFILLKMKYLGYFAGNFILLFCAIIYAFQPYVFYIALQSGISMTVMNIIWDLLSDITVSFVGLFIFHEYLTTKQLFGLVIGFIALVLLK